MKKAERKNHISFKSMLKLSRERGRIATRIITIVLSAFSFMLFIFGTTGFTYNQMNYITRVYTQYLKGKTYFSFCAEGGSPWAAKRRKINKSDIQRVEEATGLSFVYDIGKNGCIYWGYYVAGNASGTIYDKWDKNTLGVSGGTGCLAGSEEDYEGMGFTLLAGRYPTAKNEIAISEAHFQAFEKSGYRDVSKNFVWETVESYDSATGSYSEVGHFEYSYGIGSGTTVAINDYSDILGKTLGEGDIDADENAYAYTIVGVVDTDYTSIEDVSASDLDLYPQGRILFSEDWKTPTNYGYYACVYHGTNISKSEIKKCVKISLDFFEEQGLDGDFPALEYSISLCNATSSIEIFGKKIELTEAQWTLVILGGAGIIFGIFAVILNGHLISRSMEDKQKKIGILRAMGADDQTAAKIFLTEVLLTATAIFLLALVASLIVFYGWLNPWMSWEVFETGILVYNGWTVLILAAVSYLVPLVSAFVPLRKFFKKPIIDNITGNTQKKGTRSNLR